MSRPVRAARPRPTPRHCGWADVRRGAWEDPDPAKVRILAHPRDWTWLLGQYPARNPDPLKHCLDVAKAAGALTVVIETRYIDPDFRSEYVAFHARAFSTHYDTAHRLHFFKGPISPDRLWEIPVDAGYLGYMVVRPPTQLGRVGRTMLAPPPGLDDAVLTTIQENVHFFGQTISIRAVPFMEQDAQLDRCAHAAAWVCHYVAHRRGIVPRRPIAAFNLMSNPSMSPTRPVPSEGLTVGQLVELFRVFDLPARLYDVDALKTVEPTPPCAPPDPIPVVDANGKQLHGGLWNTKLFGTICRYLNSGIPVLVGNGEHAFVLVGYRRTPNPSGGSWIEFVRQDDQLGPYQPVKSVFNDVGVNGYRYSPWTALVVPLPEKLWLPPEPAEGVGATFLQQIASMVQAAVPDAKALSDCISAGALAFRTYATSANHFKDEAMRRMPNAVAREYRMARFPRFVWVVEAVDRRARDAGRTDCVLGEAVFDSTSSELDPKGLAFHVPGYALIASTKGTYRELRCPPDLYQIGTAGWE